MPRIFRLQTNEELDHPYLDFSPNQLRHSELVQNLMNDVIDVEVEDESEDNNSLPFIIPVPDHVTKQTLQILQDFLKKYETKEIPTLKEFQHYPTGKFAEEENFFKEIDNDDLTRLMLLTNFLIIDKMENHIARIFASRIKGKDVEEMREIFNLVNDFEPHEEEQLREELETFCEAMPKHNI